jgi:hypothetical protein
MMNFGTSTPSPQIGRHSRLVAVDFKAKGKLGLAHCVRAAAGLSNEAREAIDAARHLTAERGYRRPNDELGEFEQRPAARRVRVCASERQRDKRDKRDAVDPMNDKQDVRRPGSSMSSIVPAVPFPTAIRGFQTRPDREIHGESEHNSAHLWLGGRVDTRDPQC